MRRRGGGGKETTEEFAEHFLGGFGCFFLPIAPELFAGCCGRRGEGERHQVTLLRCEVNSNTSRL